MSIVAVTGATGYVGEALVHTLLSKGVKIHAIARNEGKLVDLQTKYPSISIFPCPVEDRTLLKKALHGCTGVYHLASVKDVHLANAHPLKTIQTNLIGTINVLELSVELPSISYVVTSSTDKVVTVSGVYGASKLIIETLFKEFSSISSNNCTYKAVRFGNVLNSTGSVLAKWKQAIQDNREIVVTDLEATRFFWTREQSVDFLYACAHNSDSQQVYIPSLKAASLQSLLEATLKKYASYTPPIKSIGLQQGENLHESLLDGISSDKAERWSFEELFAAI